MDSGALSAKLGITSNALDGFIPGHPPILSLGAPPPPGSEPAASRDFEVPCKCELSSKSASPPLGAECAVQQQKLKVDVLSTFGPVPPLSPNFLFLGNSFPKLLLLLGKFLLVPLNFYSYWGTLQPRSNNWQIYLVTSGP